MNLNDLSRVPRLRGPITSCQEKLDRLPWTAGAVWACDGVTVGVRATVSAALEPFVAGVPSAFRRSRASSVDVLYSIVVGGPGDRPGIKRFHWLHRGSLPLVRSLRMEEAVSTFEGDVALQVGALAHSRLFIHAGVVAIPEGVVLIPGASQSGKTSLVRALVALGAIYYSDELAVVDQDGMVSPWAEPLSIRQPGARTGTRHSAASLGLVSGDRPLAVRAVVLTNFQEGGQFVPRRSSRAEGLLGVMAHTLCARTDPQRTLNVLSRALRGAAIFEGPRGEADAAARDILKLTSTVHHHTGRE